MTEVYINKDIQSWIDRLIDLFCLEDNKPIVTLSLRKDNRSGYCYHATPLENSRITVGCKGGKIRLTTLVHEFIHAMGYRHENEINGWANFHHFHPEGVRQSKKLKGQYDNFSRLIVKDLCGKYELLI